VLLAQQPLWGCVAVEAQGGIVVDFEISWHSPFWSCVAVEALGGKVVDLRSPGTTPVGVVLQLRPWVA